MSNNAIWPIHRILPGAITPGESGPGSNSNEGVLIPQNARTEALPSDDLVSYLVHLLGRDLTPLQWYSRCILQPSPTELSWEGDEPHLSVRVRVLLTGFASLVWSTASESTVFGLPDLAWSSRFLQPGQNFLNHLVNLQGSTVFSTFEQQIFLIASVALWPNSNF